ncbi:MAG: hypothetical protein ACLQOO_35620 [Terriglobia bacterium]
MSYIHLLSKALNSGSAGVLACAALVVPGRQTAPDMKIDLEQVREAEGTRSRQ